MIKLKPFRQSPGLCGPASLKMVLDFYGISATESELEKLSGASREKGTLMSGLVKAAKHFGLHTFVKEESSLEDIEYFVKKDIPVIVDWFSGTDGHYSVVVDINKKNIILMDPETDKFLVFIRRKKIALDNFYRVWFDFPGDYIKEKKDLKLRLMLVVSPLPIKRKK